MATSHGVLHSSTAIVAHHYDFWYLGKKKGNWKKKRRRARKRRRERRNERGRGRGKEEGEEKKRKRKRKRKRNGRKGSVTLRTCTAYCKTERKLTSAGLTRLATFRWTKTSPGNRPVTFVGGTRLSEQPTQSTYGNVDEDRCERHFRTLGEG